MAFTSSRLALLRQQRLASCRLFASPLRQQQRRHYLFLPSDWSELRYRWKLFWERNTHTKIRLKWRDRRTRLEQSYRAEKKKIQDKWSSERSKLSASYQFQKLRWQGKVRHQSDLFRERYQPYYLRQKSALSQRRKDFTKRWSARRRELLQDGRDTVKGYLRKRSSIFTLEEYARPDWFDSHGRPLTSRDPTGRFVNPWLSWSTNGVHPIANIFKWRYQRAVRQWKERGLFSYLPKDLPQLLFGSALAAAAGNTSPQKRVDWTANPTEIRFTWIGHSTCLVQMGNATILTDPIFSHRCTPFPRLPGVGVAREFPPGLNLRDLPDSIDVCLISHDHYDHLDRLTILALKDRVRHWVLPKGLPDWLESRCSVDPAKMTELEWWESVRFQRNGRHHGWRVMAPPGDLEEWNRSDDDDEGSMTITCCPAQHWSSRTFFDRCKRLWCGFAVETQTPNDDNTGRPVVQKFFFAGDTGMPKNEFPLFSQIGEFCGQGMYHTARNGVETNEEVAGSEPIRPALAASPIATTFHPFDLAAIPIGAYNPSFLMQEAHMNPAEAVQCARQLQATKSVGIHWGTFALAEEPLDEPPVLLRQALEMPENRGVDFVCVPIGSSLCVPAIGVQSQSKGDEAVVRTFRGDSEVTEFA